PDLGHREPARDARPGKTEPMDEISVSRNRIRRMLLGTAEGDALGLPMEGLSPARVFWAPLRRIHPHRRRKDRAPGYPDAKTGFPLA
ncbi:MAG: hypothetical protein ACLFRG_22360, partial [Desulfococcaceae bacterium]